MVDWGVDVELGLSLELALDFRLHWVRVSFVIFSSPVSRARMRTLRLPQQRVLAPEGVDVGMNVGAGGAV